LCCALRVSHPLAALLPSRPSELVSSRYRSWGFTLRGFDPHPLPYALSDAAPPRVAPSTKKKRSPPKGLTQRAKPDVGSGVWPDPQMPVASLGFAAPRSLAPDSDEVACAPSHPLSRFSDEVARCPRRWRPRVFAARNAAVLSRDRRTSLQSPTSLTFSALWRSRRVGLMGYPRGAVRVAAHHILSSPCCRIPGRSLPRKPYR